jgi:ubiquinone/menaquinone biosynthesis C-methylase UbiE
MFEGVDLMLKVTNEYMAQMDSAMNDKELMLNYIVGNTVMDMGCGSGGLLTAIRKKFPSLNRIGMDKDLTYLNRYLHKIRMMGHRHKDEEFEDLQLIEDDVLNLYKHVATGEVDTFIFSSILHEVYSYNKFSMSKVDEVLGQAIQLLPVGGRLIIRDGVKPVNGGEIRALTFVNPEDSKKVFKFAKDFKGYKIEPTYHNDDTVFMKEQDAMEFLYTYTWGDEHYEREVQEQYGLHTPEAYISFVKRCAEDVSCGVKLVTYNHYLQEGYNYYLSKRVKYKDKQGNTLRLPDSNGLFIFEKR